MPLVPANPLQLRAFCARRGRGLEIDPTVTEKGLVFRRKSRLHKLIGSSLVFRLSSRPGAISRGPCEQFNPVGIYPSGPSYCKNGNLDRDTVLDAAQFL